MSKAVLMSIRANWVSKILTGEKTIEVRKFEPTLKRPFKCYLYESKMCGGRGKVVAEFVCRNIDLYTSGVIACAYYETNGSYVEPKRRYNQGTGLSYEAMFNYSNGDHLYGWHISNLKIYDRPKDLSEFRKPCSYHNETCQSLCKKVDCDYYKAFVSKGNDKITRPPQSWYYVEELE
jgi:predicted transcriptional regulator